MEVAVALSVVPVIVGLVVLAPSLGLPPLYEMPLAVVLGVAISLGYALAAQLPGVPVVADALLRGVAFGLASAGLIGTVRRLTMERRAIRPSGRSTRSRYSGTGWACRSADRSAH